MPDCVLAIETSTARGGVAAVCGSEVCFEQTFTSERSHNSQLFVPLKTALDHCAEHLRLLVVGTGPASYTGVRIGIAAAQGVALSRSVPVIGLPSVLAVSHAGESFMVCGDARRGVFFVAEVCHTRLRGEIVTLDAAALRRYREQHGSIPWFTFDSKPPLELSGVTVTQPSVAVLASIAATLPRDEILALAEKPLEPLYLSAPFVTMPKKS
ncbi:MAG: tRNA (adenosine(37)-N6)-threonylcarbamoyltransferase complex dimerization subunit type 1 TsaB [Roseimicrobium sp.]